MQVQNNSSATPVKNQSAVNPPSVLHQLSAASAPSIRSESPQPSSVVAPPAQSSTAKASPKTAKFAKKQIPTIFGLLILFVALISGILLFGQGTGVFAPRATPQTTPKNINVSNVTDKTFTISFYTDESTVAFVKYGEQATAIKAQASDDRDQLSGIVRDYRLHHITVRGLSPGTTYYYVLGTGSSTFDNDGQPYSVTTAVKPNQSPTNNQTIYGNVLNQAGGPAEGAVVYLYSEGMGPLSTIVKASGSFGISLSNAFSADQSVYATLTDQSKLEIKAQGIEPTTVANLQTTVAEAQPVTDLVLGQNLTASVPPENDLDKDMLLAEVDEVEMTATEEEFALEAAAIATEESSMASATPSLLEGLGNQLESEEPTPVVLNLDELEEGAPAADVVVESSQPQIKASLPPNINVRVVIHSNTQIDQIFQTDADGNLTVDVATLGKDLEPGEHTASYTYIDPITGEEITKTYQFTVTAPENRQLAQATIPTPTPTPVVPYGSGNPYVPPVTEAPTPTPTVAELEVSVTPAIGSAGAVVATTSGQYNAGSWSSTLILLGAGLFFVVTGVWSYSLAQSFAPRKRS